MTDRGNNERPPGSCPFILRGYSCAIAPQDDGAGSVAFRLNCQTAKFSSVSRGGNPRELQFVFSICSLQRGSRAPYGAPGMPALCEGQAPALRSRPRLTALHCGVLSPWCPTSLGPAFAGAGGKKDIHPGPHNGPGGCHPRTPGTAVSETAGAGAAPPSTAKLRLRRAPLCGGG